MAYYFLCGQWYFSTNFLEKIIDLHRLHFLITLSHLYLCVWSHTNNKCITYLTIISCTVWPFDLYHVTQYCQINSTNFSFANHFMQSCSLPFVMSWRKNLSSKASFIVSYIICTAMLPKLYSICEACWFLLYNYTSGLEKRP